MEHYWREGNHEVDFVIEWRGKVLGLGQKRKQAGCRRNVCLPEANAARPANSPRQRGPSLAGIPKNKSAGVVLNSGMQMQPYAGISTSSFLNCSIMH